MMQCLNEKIVNMLEKIGKTLHLHFSNILLVLFVVFFCFNTQSQEPLNLDGAIVKGLENNFQIRIAKEQYNIAELNNKWGTVGRFPSINLGIASINRYDNTR